MLQLPESTRLNRYISKEKFYTKTNITNKLRQLFVDEVEKIRWTHKISPETLNISTKDYEELQIFEITLKDRELSKEVLKHIDTFIPFPILFIIKRHDAEKAVLAYKEPHTKNETYMKIEAMYETPWTNSLNLELRGLSVDEIYRHFLQQIAPQLSDSSIQSQAGMNTKDMIESDKERQKIQKQIGTLSKKISKEPSIAKRQELARERHALETVLKELNHE